jgi:ATP-dependent DNA helicase RecG
LALSDYISKYFQLTQREKTVIGIVTRSHKILTTELSKILQLPEEDRLRNWYGGLLEKDILIAYGTGKGKSFIINPKLMSESKLNIKPSLKTLEPYVLKQLIITDIKNYPNSRISEIFERIKDVPKKEIQKVVYKLVEQDELKSSGSKTHRKYYLTEKKRN